MIKIVSGRTIPVGYAVALADMCNRFNARGHDCTLYGPDRWHLDKCRAARLSDFSPDDGDVVIVHGIGLRSYADLYELKAGAAASGRSGWRLPLGGSIFAGLASRKKPDNFKLVLTCRANDRSSLRKASLSIFHKVHFLCDVRKDASGTAPDRFACPCFLKELKPSGSKPEKVAGVIGSVRAENMPEVSIERALRDGMETVIVYGYMLDPVYYYARMEPLAKKYPGRIKYAGFVDDAQKMYDSISDVYRCAAKPWSPVRRECALTGTRFHGPENSGGGETAGNDAIFGIWSRELGLRKGGGSDVTA